MLLGQGGILHSFVAVLQPRHIVRQIQNGITGLFLVCTVSNLSGLI